MSSSFLEMSSVSESRTLFSFFGVSCINLSGVTLSLVFYENDLTLKYFVEFLYHVSYNFIRCKHNKCFGLKGLMCIEMRRLGNFYSKKILVKYLLC